MLHRDEEAVLDLPELVNLDQVGVGEQPANLRLVDEHADENSVLRQVRQDPLDDERALKTLRAPRHRAEDLRHPAVPDPIEQHILAKRLAAGVWDRRLGARYQLHHWKALSADAAGRSSLSPAVWAGGPGRTRLLHRLAGAEPGGSPVEVVAAERFAVPDIRLGNPEGEKPFVSSGPDFT